MSRTIAAGILAFAFISPASNAAQVYKCTDSAGKTVYSGQPCEYGSKAMPIASGAAQAPRKDAQQADSAKAPPSAREAAALCAHAQRDLAAAEAKPTPSGYADADKHRQGIERLKAQAKSACDEPAVAAPSGNAKAAQGAAKP